MPATGIVRIKYTLQYIPKTYDFPKTTTEDYLQQEIGDIISIMKYPSNTLTFLFYGYETKKSINHIAHILQRSTSQPRLQIIPLHPMLPQSQAKNIQHQNVIRTPAPAPRVEQVLQPPRVLTQESAHKQHPRYQTSTPPRLDPHSNPCIRRFKRYKKTPQIIKSKNNKRHPGRFNTDYAGPREMLVQNFGTQASRHLVVNHLFKLTHAYHI